MSEEEKKDQPASEEAPAQAETPPAAEETPATEEAKPDESKSEEAKPAEAKDGGDKTDYVEVAKKYGAIGLKAAGKFAGDMFASAKKSVSEISDDIKKQEEADKKPEDDKKE